MKSTKQHVGIFPPLLTKTKDHTSYQVRMQIECVRSRLAQANDGTITAFFSEFYNLQMQVNTSNCAEAALSAVAKLYSEDSWNLYDYTQDILVNPDLARAQEVILHKLSVRKLIQI